MELRGSQRKYLRGQAHGLRPVLHIGRSGLSENVMTNLEEALDSHELIKIKFQDFQDQKTEFLDRISDELRVEVVGTIGHTAVLFRQQRDPKKRRIRIPS